MAIKEHPKFAGKGSSWKLPNVKIKWAKLVKPDTKYEPVWCIDAIVSGQLKTDMAKAGFVIREYYKKEEDGTKTPQGEFYLRIKKKVHNRTGEEQKHPWCRFEDGEDFDGEQLGNDSICDVELFSRYIEPPTGKQCSAWLNGVTIKKLEPKNAEADEVF